MGLTKIQEEVVGLFFSLPQARGFALAGGAALLASGFDHRATKDLDFFTPYEQDVRNVMPHFLRALREHGFSVRVIRREDGEQDLQRESRRPGRTLFSPGNAESRRTRARRRRPWRASGLS